MSVERLGMGDAGGSGMVLRWKREDYDVVKHDSCFTDWKVLVSGADWKEQRGSGERFRSRNLPSPHVGAGVYELGVTLPAWKTGDSGALKSEDIVVVYVGYADHIRKRLQRYCQAGAYVEAPRSPISPNSSMSSWNQWNRSPVSSKQSTPHASPRRNSVEEPMMSRQKYSISEVSRSGSVNRIGRRSSRLEKQLSIERRGSLSPIAEPESDGRPSPGSGAPGSPRGPRLFSEVFALGCSIAYRWASTKSKDDAEYVVSELTDVFDYAWNRGGDSDVRSQDILQKIVLGKRGPQYSDCCSRSRSKWRFLFRRKPVGIKILAHKPPPEARMRRRPRRSSSDMSRGLCIMLLRSRPHLTIAGSKSSKHSEFTKIDIPVDRCGVLLENGLVCNALPQIGRKRCHMHLDARKPPRRKTSQVASSQDSRSGSLASEPTTSVDSLRSRLQGAPPPPPSSCFPYLATKKPKPPPVEQPRKRGSVSFSTWLSRSELLKAKSLEWLLAMEEIKGRSNNNNNNNNNDNNTDCSTSPILKPVALSPETDTLSQADYETPVKAGRISLNLSQSIGMAPPVDNGMPPTIVARRSTIRWPPAPLRETYATNYNPPPFPRISFS